jgi:hypothetical protein
MPNWCNNNLTLTHEDPAMILRAKEALDRGEFLNEFIPIPADLKITSGFLGDPVEQKKLEEDTAKNLEVHGYGNWYDYCCGEWGTKWDVGGDGQTDIHPDGTMLHTSFDSAWAPPVNAYYKLEELGFTVNAMYYEGGMAYAGEFTDGCDQEINLEGLRADDIERDHPDLDECFGISECMREYEAENEEELTAWIKDGVEQKKALITL